jgi:hypothetical protein
VNFQKIRKKGLCAPWGASRILGKTLKVLKTFRVCS